MQVTISSTAEAMLSRYPLSRERLLAILQSVPGNCFIDGKVGRIPGNDELVLRSRDHRPLSVTHPEFSDPTTMERIIQEWSSAGAE